MLELGVILVMLLALESGRGRARALLDPTPSSIFYVRVADRLVVGRAGSVSYRVRCISGPTMLDLGSEQ